jgi:formate dehydrogenase subunit gamma
MFHPSMFFFADLFGGGPWARILHPFIGVLMFISFAAMAMRYHAHNRIDEGDRAWLRRVRDVIANRDRDLPEIGKYNPGQKVMFWLMLVSLCLLVLSGIVMWRPWFAEWFPIGLNRIAVVIHALAGWALIGGIIVHAYAAFWVKGSIRAMTRGTVSEAWAKRHHPAWYREVAGK